MTEDGRKVLWRPLPGFQVRALSCAAFEVLIGGAAGPGKTSCLIGKAAGLAQDPNARVLFLRTNYTDLLDVLDRMQTLYPQLGAAWSADEKRWRFPSGGTVELGYGENMKEVARYLGREFTAILWDELGLLADEKVWLELMSRVRTTAAGVRLGMWGSANPGGPGHGWLKRRFVKVCGKHGERVYVDPDTEQTRAYIPGTLADNPLLPDSYRRRLLALPERRRKQLINGDWDAGGGIFFDELSEPTHIIPPLDHIPDHWRVWGSYDWGFRHWAVAQAFCKSSDGDLYLLDTWARRRFSDAQQADSIRSTLPSRALRQMFAGLDAFAKREAHNAAAETVADVFLRFGIILDRAHVERRAGWRTCLRVITPTQPDGSYGTPILRVCDTPGNRMWWERVTELVCDPNDAEDLLKVDADPETGEGGDDFADCFRYGVVSPQFAGPEPVRPDPAVASGERDGVVFDATPAAGRRAGVSTWQRSGARIDSAGEFDASGQFDLRGY